MNIKLIQNIEGLINNLEFDNSVPLACTQKAEGLRIRLYGAVKESFPTEVTKFTEIQSSSFYNSRGTSDYKQFYHTKSLLLGIIAGIIEPYKDKQEKTDSEIFDLKIKLENLNQHYNNAIKKSNQMGTEIEKLNAEISRQNTELTRLTKIKKFEFKRAANNAWSLLSLTTWGVLITALAFLLPLLYTLGKDNANADFQNERLKKQQTVDSLNNIIKLSAKKNN